MVQFGAQGSPHPQVDTLVIAGALASGTSNLGCKDQVSEISRDLLPFFMLPTCTFCASPQFTSILTVFLRTSGPRLHNPFHVLGPYFSKPSLSDVHNPE